MHLLVIEDERALCETIVRSLRRLAYSVDYCYDGGTKSERVMKNELREKGRGAGRTADGRSRHAVLRRLAGRGGDSAEQSNQIMSGVCGYWVKSFQAFRRPCPASGAGFRQGQRC